MSSITNTSNQANADQSQTLSPSENLHQQENKLSEENSNDRDHDQDNVPYLPTPIITDILSRLQIKALFNCRLVCKNWDSLISTPEFAQIHLSRLPTRCLIKPQNNKRLTDNLHLVDPDQPDSQESKLVFIPKINLPNVPFELINSCNGLVCLLQKSVSVNVNPSDSCNIFVCNPVLREYISLPKPLNLEKSKGYSCLFGFSHKTNQYKVILISNLAQIYTLGEGLWRNIGNAPKSPWRNYFNAFVNSVIHWIPLGRSSPYICCFDFVSEQFGTVPEPSELGPVHEQFHGQMSVSVLNENLSICNCSYYDHVDIWVMKDYGVKESWSKDYVINQMIYESECDSYEAVMITGKGEILVIFNYGSMMLYDPKSQVFVTEISIFEDISIFHAIAYVPSLISLKDVANGEDLKVL